MRNADPRAAAATVPVTMTVRWLLAASAFALGATFLLPLWEVRLVAPQYPEGLGMHILLHTVVGIRPEDLGNINGLNHYIGMKTIEPDAIPELTLMPWGMGLLIATGLGAAWWGARNAVRSWVMLFALAAVVGIVDFWKWEYDYGHSLDTENAAIVIPGMSYQPPLIGSKQLLNFTATSWPAAGGWIAIAALGLALTALVLDARRVRAGLGTLGAASLVVALGCTNGTPRAVVPGTDSCGHCRMTLVDRAFAAQAVTPTGQHVMFDAIECAMTWWRAQPTSRRGVMYFADFRVPEAWIPAHDAVVLADSRVSAPMGRSLLAFSPGTPPEALQQEFGGTIVTFDALATDTGRVGALSHDH